MSLKVLIVFFLVQAILAVEVPTKRLNDGNLMPMLALGTGRGTANESESVERVRDAVRWALQAGYRHVDTAAVYRDEAQVGAGVRDALAAGTLKRSDLFVTTKLWSDRHGREQVVPALQESLQQLGLDYVDLYLIHFPVALTAEGAPTDIDYVETWRGMEAARARGLARSIGVSNFNSSQLRRLHRAADVKPAVNQIEVNPTLTQEELVSSCEQLGVAVMAYSPFGYVVSRRKEQAPPPRVDDPALVAMATKYGKSVGQVLLRYLIERGLTPIPKSTNEARIKENLDVFDFKLTEEEVRAISAFNKDIRVIDFKGWESYPNFPFGPK